ncbi:uncharacterized protein LOC129945115 [Eupeodes corollae]|uniref:uncharacterized protein LOC129945115 n=1 Tax=Eupeodes corollae TaxID=290404 RepID=UPI00248FE204|nr:uncharacterized protein LOC129945115 [Eupeodes corollae]
MILLLMDNHESHCTIEAINFCQEHGIVLVTFPPHCTHRLQPLDVAVLGPFKHKLSVAQNDWLLNNPSKTIRIHDLPGIANTAYIAAFTPKNIVSGKLEVAVEPNINTEAREAPQDFDPSSANNESDVQYSNKNNRDISKENVASPEIARPFPKAGPRQNTKRGRKKRKSRILTETPDKNELETAYKERQKRLKKSEIHSFNKRLKLDKSTKRAIKAKKPKESSSDSDESCSYSVNDDTDLDFNFADDSFIEEVDAEYEDEACIDLSYDHLSRRLYIGGMFK